MQYGYHHATVCLGGDCRCTTYSGLSYSSLNNEVRHVSPLQGTSISVLFERQSIFYTEPVCFWYQEKSTITDKVKRAQTRFELGSINPRTKILLFCHSRLYLIKIYMQGKLKLKNSIGLCLDYTMRNARSTIEFYELNKIICPSPIR